MKKLLSFVVVATLLSGCTASMRNAKKDSKKDGKNVAGDADPNYTPDVNVAEADIRSSAFGKEPALGVIHFDYDSAALKGDALETLKKNAEWLKEHRDQEVLVAGHTDERGTIEYNLALGQKRAKEVREYYIRLGVNGKAVATISYGKEDLSCRDSNEDCWAQNRRAETRVRTRVANGKK